MQEPTTSVKTLTAYIEWDPDSQLYVGIVSGLTGAHTQGSTLDELHENLKEGIELCLEEQAIDRLGSSALARNIARDRVESESVA